jgi:hypothetical protein
MKKCFYTMALFALALQACDNDEISRDAASESVWKHEEKAKKDTSLHYSGMSYKEMKLEVKDDTTVDFKKVNIQRVFKHKFSNDASKDEFRVKVIGDKIYNANIDFTIKNEAGEEIYHEYFSANNVLENAFDGGGQYATDIQKDEYLRKWVFEFLNANRFNTPAIHKEREYFSEHSDKAIWDDIVADQTAIAFVFSKQKGSQTEIAFDKKANKVVKFYEY